MKVYDLSQKRTIRRSGRRRPTNFKNTSDDPIMIESPESKKEHNTIDILSDSNQQSKTPSILITRKSNAVKGKKVVTFSDSPSVALKTTKRVVMLSDDSTKDGGQFAKRTKVNDKNSKGFRNNNSKTGVDDIQGKKTSKRKKVTNERDVEGSNKKRHKGRIPKSGVSINNRCTPHQLAICIEELKEPQTVAVSEMGFGQLLALGLELIPGRLGKFVVDSFSVSDMTLYLDSGSVKIDCESIHRLLGLPNQGIDISGLEKRKTLAPIHKKWKERYGEPKLLLSAADIYRMIVTSNGDNGYFFKMDFLMLFLTTMVECYTNGKCIEKILYYFSGEVDFKNINWCAYIIKALQKCKKNYNSSMRRTPFTGPLAILTLIYADAVECRGFEVDRDIPAIEFWSKERLNARETFEMKNGGFGKGRIIGLSLPTTTRSPAVLMNSRISGLSLSKKIDNSKKEESQEKQMVIKSLGKPPYSAKSKNNPELDMAELLVQLSKLVEMKDMMLELKGKYENRFGEIYEQHPDNPQVVVMREEYKNMLDSRPIWLEEKKVEYSPSGTTIRNILKDLNRCYSEEKSDGEITLSKKQKNAVKGGCKDGHTGVTKDGSGPSNVNKTGLGDNEILCRNNGKLPVSSDDTTEVVGNLRNNDKKACGGRDKPTANEIAKNEDVGGADKKAKTIVNDAKQKDNDTRADGQIEGVVGLEQLEVDKDYTQIMEFVEDDTCEDEDDDTSGSTETEDGVSEELDDNGNMKTVINAETGPAKESNKDQGSKNVYEDSIKIDEAELKTSSLVDSNKEGVFSPPEVVDRDVNKLGDGSGMSVNRKQQSVLGEGNCEPPKNKHTPESGKLLDCPSFSLGLSQDLEKPVTAKREPEKQDNGKEGGDVGYVRKNPKRDKTLSKFSKSPFMVREVGIVKSFTKAEDKLWNHIFPAEETGEQIIVNAKIYEKELNKDGITPIYNWDICYLNSKGVVCETSQLKTLYNGVKVSNKVIDTWAEVLNHYEDYRAQEHSRRLFCTTNLIYDWMLRNTSEDEITRVTTFKSNMIDSHLITPEQADLRMFGMVFIPMVEDGRVYLIVFDLKNPEISLIDSIDNEKAKIPLVWDEDFYECSAAYKVKEIFIQYLEMHKHPKTEEMRHLSVNRVRAEHSTKQTSVDNGVFVMRHMEMFMGKEEPFMCGFVTNTLKKKSQVNILRKKYALKILLSENNRLRGKIIQAVDGV